MNISKNLAININMQPVPLHTILLFLKYTQKRMEKIISNTNQKDHGTTLTKYNKSICCRKPGEGEDGDGWKKTHFWTLLQQLLKITEDYNNDDIFQHKKIQFEQTYNTFNKQILNKQLPNTRTLLCRNYSNIYYEYSISLVVPPPPFPSPTLDILVAVLRFNIIFLNNYKTVKQKQFCNLGKKGTPLSQLKVGSSILEYTLSKLTIQQFV